MVQLKQIQAGSAPGQPIVAGPASPYAPAYASAPTTTDANADVQWGPSATTQKALVLQAKDSQTATVVEVQDKDGNKLVAIGPTGSFDMAGISAPALSPAGEGRIYFDSTANKFKVSENNGAYTDLVSGGGTPGGATTNVQFNNAGAFDGDAEFTWNTSTKVLSVTGEISSTRSGAGANSQFYGPNAGLNSTGTYCTAVGDGALQSNVGGINHTAVGRNALNNAGTAENRNTAVGSSAGLNAAGTSNSWFGVAAGLNAAGDYNVGVGDNALRINIGVNAVTRNVAVGFEALYQGGSTFQDNVAIGYYAGRAMGASSRENVIIGSQAGVTLVSNAIGNVLMGFQAAGSANTGDDYNIAIGYQAGYQLDNQGNVFIGYQAGYDNIGPYNVAIGYGAMDMLGAGDFSSYSIAIGYQSMFNADANSDYNVCLGYQSGYALNQSNNVAIGNNSMSAATSAQYNTCVGSGSGDGLTTGDYNTFLGNGAGGGGTITTSENVGIGRNTFQCNGTGSVVIGTTSATSTTAVQNYCAVVGYSTLGTTGTKTDCVGLGRQVLDGATTVTGLVAIGSYALQVVQAGSYQIGVGYQCLDSLTSGTGNTAVGYEAGQALTTHSNNVLMGYSAMADVAGATTANNVVIGFEAAKGHSSYTKLDSVIIGYRADYLVSATNRTTDKCVFIGYEAGYANTQTGTTDRVGNVAIGYRSMYQSNDCDYNTAVGYLSGYGITTGTYNTILGSAAGYDVTTAQHQVLIGTRAQRGSVGADFAVVLGAGDNGTTYANPQATAQGAVAIGAGTVVTVADIASIGARGFDLVGRAAPALSAAGEGRIYFDSTANVFKVSENGGAYQDLVGGGGTPGGANTQIQFNDSGAFGGSANLTWNGSVLYVNGKLTVTGAIDPTALILDGAEDEVYVEFDSGSTVATAGAGKARIRYNNAAKQLEFSLDTGAWEAFSSGPGSSSSSEAWGGIIQWTARAGTYSAEAFDGILADTTGAAWTLTLPSNPSPGDAIGVMDVYGTFATNGLTVDRNGSKIMGLAENLVCDVNDAAFQLIYTGSAKGWKMFSYLQQGSDQTSPAGPTSSIQYNDNGAFGGSANLTWADSVLSINGVTEYSSVPAAEYAPAGKGRIRYNDEMKQFEASMDGSEWLPFGPAASSSSSSSGLGTITDARKYIQTIGNGVATSFDIQHNLETEDVTVQVWETTGNRELVTVDVQIINENSVRITFAAAPEVNAYNAVVVG